MEGFPAICLVTKLVSKTEVALPTPKQIEGKMQIIAMRLRVKNDIVQSG
jgi:hypothetical protein